MIMNIGSLSVTPVMTQTVFAENSGLRKHQIRGQIERKNLPIMKVGKHNLINIAQLATDLHSATVVYCPAMTAEQFSNLSGLTKSQVEYYLSTNHLPRREVGRLILLDIAELFRLCLKQDPALTPA